MYYEMFVLGNHENYFSEKNRERGANWVVVSEFNSVSAVFISLNGSVSVPPERAVARFSGTEAMG